jgi:hypothetical protein
MQGPSRCEVGGFSSFESAAIGLAIAQSLPSTADEMIE